MAGIGSFLPIMFADYFLPLSQQPNFDQGLLAVRRRAAAVAGPQVPAAGMLQRSERAADRGQDLELQRGDAHVDLLQLSARHQAADGSN